MVKHTHAKRLLAGVALLLVLAFCFAVGAFAADASVESGTAAGHYRHPVTGIIEDSGGESSEALGQSMVDSVVTHDALVETAPDGTLYLSLRFNLMSNISEVLIQVQKPGDSSWETVPFQSTAQGEDTQDLRLVIPGKDAIVRAECFVDAMGRPVVFYVDISDLKAGNTAGFATLTDVPVTTGSAPAASGGTVVAGNETLGLVTGGSGTAAKPAAEAAAPAAAAPAAASGTAELTIGAHVWIMFFLLVFCAQLLACLAFWGIKLLFDRTVGKRDSQDEEEQGSAFVPDDADDEEFDTGLLNDDWAEDENERP